MQQRHVTGLLAAAIVVAIVAGCTLWPGITTFDSTFPAENGVAGTAVAVEDRTGLMAGLDIDPDVVPPPAEEGASDHPDGIVVTWVGGACDAHVGFVFERAGAGYALTGMTVTTDQVCWAIGIERRILLVLRTPVPAGTVNVTMGDRTL